jgi:hypothetical protein
LDNLQYYPDIYLQKLRDSKKIFSKDLCVLSRLIFKLRTSKILSRVGGLRVAYKTGFLLVDWVY